MNDWLLACDIAPKHSGFAFFQKDELKSVMTDPMFWTAPPKISVVIEAPTYKRGSNSVADIARMVGWYEGYFSGRGHQVYTLTDIEWHQAFTGDRTASKALVWRTLQLRMPDIAERFPALVTGGTRAVRGDMIDAVCLGLVWLEKSKFREKLEAQ